jgi:hypothetical protein
VVLKINQNYFLNRLVVRKPQKNVKVSQELNKRLVFEKKHHRELLHGSFAIF